jgi:hypothetical protein
MKIKIVDYFIFKAGIGFSCILLLWSQCISHLLIRSRFGALEIKNDGS